MCGLIAVLRPNHKPAAKMIWRRYKQQKSRGSQGFGYVAVNPDLSITVFRSTDEKPIQDALHRERASMILFHHRFPSSTPNLVESAHPLLVEHSTLAHRYLVMHNGVITNPEAMRTKHLKMGFKYQTDLVESTVTKWTTPSGQVYEEEEKDDEVFNDSEALAIEIALTIEGKQEKIETTGSAACLVLQLEKYADKATAFYFFRNDRNPLLVSSNDEGYCLASEIGGVTVPDDFMRRMDIRTGEVEVTTIPTPKGYLYQSPGYKYDEYAVDGGHPSSPVSPKGGTGSIPLLDVPERRPAGFRSAETDDMAEHISSHLGKHKATLSVMEEEVARALGLDREDSEVWLEQKALVEAQEDELETELGTLEDIIEEGERELQLLKEKAEETGEWAIFYNAVESQDEAKRRRDVVERELEQRAQILGS